MTLEMQLRREQKDERTLYKAVAIEPTISDSVAVIYERNKFVYGGSPRPRVGVGVGAGIADRRELQREPTQREANRASNESS